MSQTIISFSDLTHPELLVLLLQHITIMFHHSGKKYNFPAWKKEQILRVDSLYHSHLLTLFKNL